MLCMACEKAVKVRDPTTGKEVELVPIKVWQLAIHNTPH